MPPGSDSLLTAVEIANRLNQASPDPELEALAKANAHLRPAAVLMPLLLENNRWHLLFTRRTETLNSHKGQVAFPGGAAEPDDESPAATALREAYEEIGLKPQDAQVLGYLTRRPTISLYLVTPVVAQVPWPYPYQLSPTEVSRIFIMPLDWLAMASNYEYRPRATLGGFYARVIHYNLYDGEILWGASAHMTLDLLKTLDLLSSNP